MVGGRSSTEETVETVRCPVCGRDVTFSATYRRTERGERLLVDFGCNMRGHCGITEWDPCPLYVIYREMRSDAKGGRRFGRG